MHEITAFHSMCINKQCFPLNQPNFTPFSALAPPDQNQALKRGDIRISHNPSIRIHPHLTVSHCGRSTLNPEKKLAHDRVITSFQP